MVTGSRSLYSLVCSIGLWGTLTTGTSGCSDSPSEPLVCGEGRAFADVDFAGVWHLEIRYVDFLSGSGAMRIDRVGDGYEIAVSGSRSSDVQIDDSGMRAFMTIDQGPDVPTRTRRYEICSVDADGTITGSYEFCIDADCYPATIVGRKVEPLDEPVAAGVTEISEYNGPAGEWAGSSLTVNVRVHQGMAYVARYYDGLRVVDLADPTQPVERGHLPVAIPGGERYNDVKVAEGPNGEIYALMASSARGVIVVDVSDPNAPVEVTTFPGADQAPSGPPSVHTLFVDNQRAYVSYNYDESLRIYDISDPANPQPLGMFANPRLGQEGGTLHDLYVDGDRAYLNYWNLGMSVVDVADPANPVLLGEYRDYGGHTSHSNWVTQVGGRTISVHGDEQYGAHVRVVDVDPASGQFLDTLGSYETRPEVSVHNILAYGDRAYVTYYQDGLRVLDLSTPEDPKEVAHYQTWPGPIPGYGESFYEGAIGVDFDPSTSTVYLADTHRGLIVLTVP